MFNPTPSLPRAPWADASAPVTWNEYAAKLKIMSHYAAFDPVTNVDRRHEESSKICWITTEKRPDQIQTSVEICPVSITQKDRHRQKAG
jgi:hypothetical protein